MFLRRIEGLVLLCSLVLLVSPSLAESQGADVGTTSDQTVLLAAVGDVLMHSGIKRSAEDQRRRKTGLAPHLGFDWVLASLRPLLEKADLALCNVEFPVRPFDASDPYHFKTAGPYNFRAPPAAIEALRWAGFDVGHLANNHMWNAGREGLDATLKSMKARGLLALGAGRGTRKSEEGILVERRGVKVALLGACESHLGANLNDPGPDGLWVNRIDALAGNLGRWRMRIAAARRKADVVVFSVHWGPREYVRTPDEGVVRLGRSLCEAGVDLVLGHHPHVLQPIEAYRTKSGRSCLIAWSLGNAVSNQSPDFVGTPADLEMARRRYGSGGVPRRRDAAYGDRRDGLVLYVELARRPPAIRSWGWLPLWTWNNFYDYVGGSAPRRVRVVALDEEIRRLRDRLQLLETRKARTTELLGAGALVAPPGRSGQAWQLPNRNRPQQASRKDG